MNNIIWLETQNGELLNLSKIAFINHRIFGDHVEIRACFSEDIGPLVIANVSTVMVAQKFLRNISRMMKTNIKCIDASLLVEQAENERE